MLAITRCNSRNCRTEFILRGALGELGVTEFVGFERFIMHLIKRRDSIVPFQQCSSRPYQLDRMSVHLPYRIEYRMIMGIENILFEL